jgi:hypothetical protein
LARNSYNVVSSKQIRGEPQNARKAQRWRVRAMRPLQGIADHDPMVMIGSIIQDR